MSTGDVIAVIAMVAAGMLFAAILGSLASGKINHAIVGVVLMALLAVACNPPRRPR